MNQHKNGHEKVVFKEGNFKEFEHVDKDGNETGEMKEEFEKSGWMNDDKDEEVDMHIKGHGSDNEQSGDFLDGQEKGKWNQFIDSTKKMVNSLKDDASDWYNGDSTETSKNSSSDASAESSKSSSTSSGASSETAKSSSQDTSSSSSTSKSSSNSSSSTSSSSSSSKST